MKKLHIAILTIIFLIIVCSIITTIKAVEIYNKNNEVLITSEYSEQCQKIVDNGDTVIHTLFNRKGENPVKIETIYTFEDGVVSSLKMIAYCETVNWAKTMEHTKYGNEDKLTRYRDKNMLVNEFKEFEKSTKEEVLEKLNNQNNGIKTIE